MKELRTKRRLNQHRKTILSRTVSTRVTRKPASSAITPASSISKNPSLPQEHDDEAPERLLGPGSYFGEVALISDMPRSCTAKSVTMSEMSELDKSSFEKCMKDYPETLQGSVKGVSLSQRPTKPCPKSSSIQASPHKLPHLSALAFPSHR